MSVKKQYEKFLSKLPAVLRRIEQNNDRDEDSTVYQEHLKKMKELATDEKLAHLEDELTLFF